MERGLRRRFRITPTVTPAQWLAWLGWEAQVWQGLTVTNEEGFSYAYMNCALGSPPYSDTNLNATVDFWLETRTDRPAWLTVADVLATNSFPVRAGTGRLRLRHLRQLSR